MDKATHQRNQGTQGVGFGEVFVEVTEKTQLLGLGFFRRSEIGVWPGQKTAPGETVLKDCNSEIKS